MQFNSLEFTLFFIIVVVINYLLKHKYRWLLLLSASYYFYMSWSAKYALLMALSTIITYISGILISDANSISDVKEKGKRKKILVIISFASNLSILFFYKYINMFIDSFNLFFEKTGVNHDFINFDILLPVGISFYTFQALSYTMDVYNGDVTAKKHFGKYALFVSFFPQLVAGPIERSKNLLEQFDEEKKINYNNIRDGFYLFTWGLFKKVVVADRLAVVVNTVYNSPNEYEGLTLVIATVFFAFQIYTDFSSYSDMAIGSAKIMGYDLMKNFDRPYLSKSIAEFWRRWHISLGTWFRDYMYFPMGGSRVSKYRKYRNILTVFIVSGMWHGASWNFIIWGGLHGTYQVLGYELKSIRDYLVQILKIDRNSVGHRVYSIISTFILVDFAWVFFRANSFEDAITIVKKMFVFNPWILIDGSLYSLGLSEQDFKLSLLLILSLLIIHILQQKIKVREVIYRQFPLYRYSFIVIVLLFIVVFGFYGKNQEEVFIYFQF